MSKHPDIQTILKKAAEKEGINEFTTEVIMGKGQGHDLAPDVLYRKIIDKGNSEKNFDVVVKTVHQSSSIAGKMFPVNKLFENECYFNDKVWPNMQDFQREVANEIIFDKIPKCYAIDTESENKMIVLEYLGSKHFNIFKKDLCFDKKHLEYILEQYGKFHAVSMALKKHKPEVYLKQSRKFNDNLSNLPNIPQVKESLNEIMKTSMEYLQEEKEDEIITKFEAYVKDIGKIHENSVKYQGSNGVIMHGDCWNHNMMFKYGESREIEDMRFLNFYSSREGTPVYDLSYCLYSGGTEEILNELDSYLKVYHKSLSETLTKFNCDVKELYPYETLQQEWKEYSRFGFIMSLLVLRQQLVFSGKDMNLEEILEKPEDTRDIYDKIQFKKRTLVLIRHMYKNKFL